SPHLVEPDPSTPHPGDGSALLDGSASPRRLSRRQFLGSVGAVGLAAAGAVGYLGWGQPGATRRVAPARTSSVAVRRPPETPGGLSLVGEDQLPDRMMLQFSSPVRSVTAGAAAPALPEVAQPSPVEVSIPKSPAGYQGIVEVVGSGGDQLSLPLQVPPLSP